MIENFTLKHFQSLLKIIYQRATIASKYYNTRMLTRIIPGIMYSYIAYMKGGADAAQASDLRELFFSRLFPRSHCHRRARRNTQKTITIKIKPTTNAGTRRYIQMYECMHTQYVCIYIHYTCIIVRQHLIIRRILYLYKPGYLRLLGQQINTQ